jgi:hypothetical protein
MHEGKSEWQHLDTAPKDGTIILGWSDMWNEYHLIRWDKSEGCWCEGSWCFTDPPVHWMPLPAPPSSTEER